MGKKIVIIGSGGRLGAALLREWQASGDAVVGFNHQQMDIGNFDEVRGKLSGLDFDVLVNCAAQTNVDRCEKEPAEALLLNGQAVATLGEICTAKGARCVQISTDYVFGGEKRQPYTEKDEVHPVSVYGESKLRGEQCLQAFGEDHLAVRVSWVFGPDRASFVDQILQRAIDYEAVQAIEDKVAVPTYTLDIAGLLRPLLERNTVSGVIHLCNRGFCTWQEYGQHAINCALAAGVELRGRQVGGLKLADLKAFLARRPVYSAMSTELFERITGMIPRPWEDAVDDYVRTHWAPSRRRV